MRVTSVAGSLAPSELEAALERVHDEAGPSLPEMEALLAPAGSHAMLEGVKLSELLDGGEESKKILKKGLIFLKKRMYPTALEWWRLNRQKLDASKARLELLLLMMEAYTVTLSGEKGGKVLEKIRGHPLYSKYKAK